MSDIEGVLPVHKPAGMTSHDVVATVRKLLKMRRIGHTGTLDPDVTGALPLCLGRATRLVEYLQEQPKEYRARVRFGIATDTQDLSGRVLETVDDVRIDLGQLTEAMRSFVGEYDQLPPMYSAVKIDGKKLYELAREGKEIERKPRRVVIDELELISCDLDAVKPTADFRVVCSKGTYIRTLCYDLGLKLGVPAAMDHLIRTRSGPVQLEQCVSLEQIAAAAERGTISELLIPADRLLDHILAVYVDPNTAKDAAYGKSVVLQADEIDPGVDRVRLYTEEERFLGIYRYDRARRLAVPVKVFV